MKVKDSMTREVVAVRPETSLKEVARLLSARGISGVPVVDEAGRVLGVVSESDFLLKERGQHSPPVEQRSRLYRHDAAAIETKLAARTAGEAMTAPAVTVHPDASLAAAAADMVERGVNRMPVVQAGRLLGILTRADFVRAFARSDDEIAREIRDAVRSLRIPLATVRLAVRDGDVWLAGELEARTQANSLRERVEQIAGVCAVHADLRWQRESLAPAVGETDEGGAASSAVPDEEPVLLHEP